MFHIKEKKLIDNEETQQGRGETDELGSLCPSLLRVDNNEIEARETVGQQQWAHQSVRPRLSL